MARYPRVANYQEAKDWIMGGRSKTSRPLYDRSLSVRLVDPTDPESDITLHYRWRHTHLTSEYGESLTRNKSNGNNNWANHRYPILIYKHDGSIVLSDEHKKFAGSRRAMVSYAGVMDIYRVNGVVKIRQASDQLIPAKRKSRGCRACNAEKHIVYTCWDSGPVKEDVDMLLKANLSIGCHAYLHEQHTPHIVKQPCGKCSGLGFTVPKGRWDSLVWQDGCDIIIRRDERAKEESCS